LWMGELEPWFDEASISKIWLNYGETVNVKLIRDKFSSANNAGYCFVEFSSAAAAAKALNLHGTPMPGSNKTFKLNWAAGANPGGLAMKKEERDYSIFVGDLASDVVESALFQLFQSRYRSCKSVKIMVDSATNLSKGYGFVRFADEADMQHALTEMQGFYFNGRPLRISNAQGHGGPGGPGPIMYSPQMGMPPVGYFGAPQSMNQFTDPNNTTVFVGGLSSNVTEDELRLFFTSFGDITYVKIPPGKGCGFVQFVQRHSAEQAITQMQGYPIGNSRVRLSWGRSQNQNGLANTPYRANPPPPV
ncbi:RNA-binding domain-containing protein, partial [Nadsonia fulvescens var. elongata DSM 6958]